MPVRELVDVRVLGPFEVRHAGHPIGPAGAKRRGLLAMLALRANREVPVAELVDGIWGEAPPASAVNVVQTYVSAWRKALVAAGRDRLATTLTGYRLALGADELDLGRFRHAVDEAAASAGRGDHLAAAGHLQRALAEWSGEPICDFAALPFHAAESARLTEARLAAVERWAVAELESGGAAEIVPVLAAELAAHPLRERLTELITWALARMGRQDEALRAYDALRRSLADELGVDPGAAVRAMHERVLRQDVTLAPPAVEDRDSVAALPVLTDSFVGRDAEVTQLSRLVGEHRLVTLVGPGGVGKTRLAIETARALRHCWPVVFVDATPLTQGAMITGRLAQALRVRSVPGRSPLDDIAAALGGRPVLVVLDNLEHLADAAAPVVDLLGTVDGLRILATSRAALEARGEYRFPVSPLATDGSAVRLFADRAAAAGGPGAATAGDDHVVAAICRQLDGLPLAIELAASRCRALTPTALLSRIDRALDLLHGGGDRPARHRGLRATVEWSYDLLNPRAQRVLAACSVFRGGWNSLAAAAVTGDEDEVVILNDLDQLLDASLIESVPGNPPRFRMLETLRSFAAERLPDVGIRDRHAEFFVDLVREAEPHLLGPRRNEWLDRLETDRDNVSAALHWLVTSGRADVAAPAAAALWRYWHLRGHLDEGRSLGNAVLDGLESSAHATLRIDLLEALGSLAYWQRDYAEARRRYEAALAAAEEHQLHGRIAQAHYDLGFVAMYELAPDQARWCFTRALTEFLELGDDRGAANAVTGLALMDRVTGDYDRARDRAGIGRAEQLRLQDEVNATNTLALLGSIEAKRGNLETAERTLREALETYYRSNDVLGAVWMLHELAATAAVRGSPHCALRLSAAAHAITGQTGGGIGPEQLDLSDALELAAAEVGERAAAESRAAGARLTFDEAVAEALGDGAAVQLGELAGQREVSRPPGRP